MFITIVRTFVLYITVIVAIRIMGKRQVGDLQPGELVVTILISEIAAIPIQDINQPVITGVIAIFTLVILEILISILSMKFTWTRKIINGNSVVIINNGKIDQDLMKKLRVTVIDLMEVLRGQNVFDIDQVAYAILETNGSLSVLLKPEYRNATAGDVKCELENDVMPSLVVSDGIILKEGIVLAKTSKSNVLDILKKDKIKLKEVYLMTLDQNGEKIIIKKQKGV